MCKVEEFKISDMAEKDKQAYRTFKDLHQHYIVSGGKPAESLASIWKCTPPEMIEQAVPI